MLFEHNLMLSTELLCKSLIMRSKSKIQQLKVNKSLPFMS